MSDEQLFPTSFPSTESFQQSQASQTESDADCEIDEEFEEITSEEVDHVVSVLEDLCETVSSLNIRAYLEEAAANIHYLVYDQEDLEEAA